MDHGTPDSTEILYNMHVAATSAQASTTQPASDRAGDNPDLKGPVTRYTVIFNVSADRLRLDSTPDGVHHGNLEVTLLGYDRDGKPLNWMVRMIELSLPPDRYAVAQANGVTFALSIDVPASDIYLRSGIYDQASGKAGTLEIPLTSITVARK